MITDDVKRKILKVYLGNFYGSLSSEEVGKFKGMFPKMETVMVRDRSAVSLKKAALFHLLAFGKQSYRLLYTYNLVDFYLKTPVEGQDDEQTFYDTTSQFLIMYHMANTMENRQLENMVCHTLNLRLLERKPTLMLIESPLPQVRNWFAANKLRCLESGVGDPLVEGNEL